MISFFRSLVKNLGTKIIITIILDFRDFSKFRIYFLQLYPLNFLFYSAFIILAFYQGVN